MSDPMLSPGGSVGGIVSALHSAVALLCPVQRAIGRVTIESQCVAPMVEEVVIHGLWLVTSMQLTYLRWVVDEHRPAGCMVRLVVKRPRWAAWLMDQLPYLPPRFDLCKFHPIEHPHGHQP